jgi:serine/threonine protein kinase
MNELGEGTYSRVKRIEINGTKFALKEYKGVDTPSYNIPSDAIREISMMRNLEFESRIPNIISIISHPRNSGTSLLMDLIPGLTLTQIIKQCKTVHDKCLVVEKYLPSILESIKRIHMHGIVHNDLNTNNIIIYEDQAYIIDFGLATFNGFFDIRPNIFKTPELMIEGMNSYQSDYWLLGAFILRMCSDNSSYCPIDTNSIDDFRLVLSKRMNRCEFNSLLESNEIHDHVYIPNCITNNLANELKWMLQFNKNDRVRMYIPHYSLSQELNRLDTTHYILANNTIKLIASHLLELLRPYDIHGIQPSVLGVSIDVLKRLIECGMTKVEPITLSLSIISIVCADEDMNNLRLQYPKITPFINMRRKLILDRIEWRVFTPVNIQLTYECKLKESCRKIIDDDHCHELLMMSEIQLSDYFNS